MNIIVSGVGGQGVLTTSAILGHAALGAGYDVKVAELHGLAVRFGPLEAHVRIAKRVLSPLISLGEADVIIGLERLETLRALRFANKKTYVLFDQRAAIPPLCYIKNEKYPTESQTIKQIHIITKNIYATHATLDVKKHGLNPITTNSYLLGALCKLKLLPFSQSYVEKAIEKVVPHRALEQNRKAFNLGLKL